MRHIILSHDEAVTVAVWVLFAWVHEAATHSPILLVTSAEKDSGKTTLISLAGFMLPRVLNTVGISEAALYRSLEKWNPSFVIDEADTILADNEPLRAVINSGWTRGSSVVRCIGNELTPHPFPTFAPKALGMKGRKLPDTTLSRCIVIELKRKRPSEHCEHFDHLDNAELSDLRRQLCRWSSDNLDVLKIARPVLPPGFENRLGDNWRLPLAIADHVGGEWPEKVRGAAVTVSKVIDSASVGTQLLADIRVVFAAAGQDRLSSTGLVEALTALEDRPWAEWKGGKPITKNQLARLLAPFGIASGTIRLDTTGTPKGYQLAHFRDAFERYLGENPSP